MLTVVLGVAVLGIAMLAVAIVTGNTFVAVLVIALAALGLVLLARDGLKERKYFDATDPDGRSDRDQQPPDEHAHASLQPDEFEPDVLYEESDATAGDVADDTREDQYRGAGHDTGAT